MRGLAAGQRAKPLRPMGSTLSRRRSLVKPTECHPVDYTGGTDPPLSGDVQILPMQPPNDNAVEQVAGALTAGRDARSTVPDRPLTPRVRDQAGRPAAIREAEAVVRNGHRVVRTARTAQGPVAAVEEPVQARLHRLPTVPWCS